MAHTDESLRKLVERLNAFKADVTVTSTQFEDIEQVYGFTWNAHSIITHERIRLNAVSAVCFDWHHTYVSDGLGDAELGACMRACWKSKSRVTYAELGEYIMGWVLPKSMPSVKRLFEPKACKNNLAKGDFSCSASTFRTLAPLVLL